MAPTNFSSCPGGQHGDHTKTISSASGPSVVVVVNISSDDDEATSGPREAARRRRPSSPVRAPVSSTGGDAAARAARPRSPSPVGSPLSDFAASSDTDVMPFQPRREREVKRQNWSGNDEQVLLATMARLRKENEDFIPSASVILKELSKTKFSRRDMSTAALSNKIVALREKHEEAVYKKKAKVPPRPKRRRRTWCRNRMLYDLSKDVWSDQEDANADPEDPRI